MVETRLRLQSHPSSLCGMVVMGAVGRVDVVVSSSPALRRVVVAVRRLVVAFHGEVVRSTHSLIVSTIKKEKKRKKGNKKLTQGPERRFTVVRA